MGVALDLAINLILRVSSRQLALNLTRFIVAVFLYGLTVSAGSWVRDLYGAITHKSSFLGRVLRFTPVPVVAKGLDWAVHKFHHKASHHAAASVAPMAHYLDGLAVRSRALNMANVAVAESTAQGFYDLRHKVMVPYVRAHVRPVMRKAVAAGATADIALRREKAEERSRRRSISHINAKLGALLLGFAGIDALVKRQHAKAHHHAHTHTIPQTVAQVGRTKAQVKSHARRIARLEKLLGVGALTGILTAILARTIPSWRCSNFHNIRRLLKCSHWRWLEAMLFLAVDALLLRDLCQMVTYAQTAMESIVPRYIEPLVLDAENLICGGRESAPWGIVASDWEDVPARTWGV